MNPAQLPIGVVEDAADAQADARTFAKLQRPQKFSQDNVPLRDVLAQLADIGNIDILVDNKALSDIGFDPNAPVSVNIREPQPIAQLLKLVLRVADGDELGYSIEHGVVLVSSRPELARHVVTRVYDVSTIGDPGQIGDAICQHIAPKSWDSGVSRLRVFNDKLIITTSEPDQREIVKLLRMLGPAGDQAEPTGPGEANGKPDGQAAK